ncbi:MAG: hypothetical protein AAF293_08840 [Pseudomonadota bacterium]
MTDSKKATQPETMSDDALDAAAGGGPKTFGPLNAKLDHTFFDDGKVVKKIIYADASGSGNSTGNGGAPTPNTYTFHEDIDDDLVPVTYKLD